VADPSAPSRSRAAPCSSSPTNLSCISYFICALLLLYDSRNCLPLLYDSSRSFTDRCISTRFASTTPLHVTTPQLHHQRDQLQNGSNPTLAASINTHRTDTLTHLALDIAYQLSRLLKLGLETLASRITTEGPPLPPRVLFNDHLSPPNVVYKPPICHLSAA
jgi:hypothetical protein